MIDKKHKMKSGKTTATHHDMGSRAGLVTLTRWMKALMEQEDKERKGG